MGFSRRSFLKLCASSAAAIAIPSLAFVKTDEEIKPGIRHIGNVREVIVQDVRYDGYIVRHDVLCGKKDDSGNTVAYQYGVDSRVRDLSELPEAKEIALKQLRGWMIEDNVDFNATVPLDFKAGGILK